MVSNLLDIAASRWWVPILRGIAAVAFGVLAVVTPAAGFLALVLLWGAYALVDGALELVDAYKAQRAGARWGWSAFAGIAGIAAGVVTFVYPHITSIVLLFIIGAWAIAVGLMEIFAAIELRKERAGAGWLTLAGVASILFGVLVFARPSSGALALVWTIGLFAIVIGVMHLGLGFRLHRLRTGGSPRGFTGGAAHAT
jgi:uncharacterized membrane protein HdeD (DUF308 family)